MKKRRTTVVDAAFHRKYASFPLILQELRQ
jgi:hypothetical protein